MRLPEYWGSLPLPSSTKNKEIILPLYNSLVCPHLEYAPQFLSQNLKRDINTIENVHRRSTKMIPEKKHSSSQHLNDLDLIGIVQSRLGGKFIEVLKYLTGFTTAGARGLPTQKLIFVATSRMIGIHRSSVDLRRRTTEIGFPIISDYFQCQKYRFRDVGHRRKCQGFCALKSSELKHALRNYLSMYFH